MTAKLDSLWVFSDMYNPQTTGSALKIQFFVCWGLITTKLYNFLYLVNRRSHKVGRTLKMTARMDLLWVFEDMYTPQTNGSAPKMPFFWALYDEI